jgi:hypothetical protein
MFSLKPLTSWVRENIVASLAILVLLFLFLFGNFSQTGVRQIATNGVIKDRGTTGYEDVPQALEAVGAPNLGSQETTTTSERMVVQETNASLVVKDVSGTADQVVAYAESVGGFMVSSSVTRPEESPVATVVVRVPSAKLKAVMEHYRSLAVKVSSENLRGRDVTQDYEDIDARIATLQETITRFEEIREAATKVSELLTVTREIISLQRQIDSLEGRKQYLEDTAAYAKITIYLATDELALPYQPPTGFRPGVVFREAVRSLLTTLYSWASKLIWVGVYSVIWLPVLLVGIFFWRRWKKKPVSTKSA